MRQEQTSTFAKAAIDQLLSVISLASMARSCDSERHAKEYLKTAGDWLPRIEESIEAMRRDLRQAGVEVPKR